VIGSHKVASIGSKLLLLLLDEHLDIAIRYNAAIRRVFRALDETISMDVEKRIACVSGTAGVTEARKLALSLELRLQQLTSVRIYPVDMLTCLFEKQLENLRKLLWLVHIEVQLMLDA
jgi:hypothetical protein